MIEKYVFGPVAYQKPAEFSRADLEFYGIDHFRPSYHARIFLNDADVDISNARADRPSYAGSFSIFGHQICSGSEDHCEVHQHLRRFDDRPSHPLTRAFKRVVVTETLKRTPERPLTVTVIVSTDPNVNSEFDGDLLAVGGVQLAIFK